MTRARSREALAFGVGLGQFYDPRERCLDDLTPTLIPNRDHEVATVAAGECITSHVGQGLDGLMGQGTSSCPTAPSLLAMRLAGSRFRTELI